MFNHAVKLPLSLDVAAIRRAIDYIEKALNDRDFIDLYFETSHVFSAIVGMFGTKALDSVSSYEKHRHSFTAQTRFPDLRRRGAPDTAPTRRIALKAKPASALVDPIALQPCGLVYRLALSCDATGTINEGQLS